MSEFYQFNDGGRGPKTYSTYRLNKRGIVTYEETKGVDYMKSPINDTFSIKDGAATWKNQAEDGHQANATLFQVQEQVQSERAAQLAKELTHHL